MTCQCPSCLSLNCRRSRVRWYDWARILLLQQPVRCHTCFHRFHRFILSPGTKPTEPERVADLTPKKL